MILSAWMLLLLWPASAARAAEVLTLEQCLREASRRNPALEAARQTLRGSRARHQGSYSGFLPSLSAEAGYSQSDSALEAGGSAFREESSAGLSARQSLFAGLRDAAEVRQSAAEVRAAQSGLQAALAQVSAELKSAFARLLYSQDQLALAEAIAERRGGNVRLVELRYEAGREHKGSFLRSRAAFSQARFEVSQARRARKVAQRELARSLGRPEPGVLEATGALKVEPPGPEPDFALLAARTPSVLEAEAQKEAAQAGVTAARSDFFPELAASASASRGGGRWPPHLRRWSAGLSLSFPFFTGGSGFFAERGARAESARALAGAESARDQALLDLEESFAAYQDAAERTLVQEEFLQAAQTRAQIARSQYTSGLLSFEDWDLIENDLISTQKARLASLRDAALARAAWERAQGQGAIP